MTLGVYSTRGSGSAPDSLLQLSSDPSPSDRMLVGRYLIIDGLTAPVFDGVVAADWYVAGRLEMC